MALKFIEHRFDDSKRPPDLLPATTQLVNKWLPIMMAQQVESGSIYSGYGGTAYILYRLGCHPLEGNGKKHFEDCLAVIKDAMQVTSSRRCTFLEGPVGLKALAAAALSKLARPFEESLQQVLRPPRFSSSDECEVLYGRAGYLQAILFLRKELNMPRLGHDVVLPILTEIIEAGYKGRYGDRDLVWRWHDKEYLGAAHGTAGILLVLSHFLDELRDVGVDCHTLNQVLLEGLRYRDGAKNIRSRPDSERDGLVHWCHGAPGWIAPTLRLLPDEVRGLGEVTWKRGVLATKGLGLCHGVCGNAYAFLQLYQHTRDEAWLWRAEYFASFAVTQWNRFYELADRPLSLFEGVGGALSLLLDLRNPEDATFCGYYLR